MTDPSVFPEPGEELVAADPFLLELLTAALGCEQGADLLLTDATVDALEREVAPVPLSTSLRQRLTRVGRQAELDAEFLASHSGRRAPTMGGYLSFLRRKAEWSLSEASKRLRLDFQWLTELERDALSPVQISARKLAQLVKRLKGSFEMTERLLVSTVQASPFLATPARDSLYRRGSAASQGRWAEPPDDLMANPEYEEQIEAVAALREQLREEWQRAARE